MCFSFRSLCIVISVFVVTANASANDGFYLGAGWQRSSVEGDFDGKNFYGNGSDSIIVPKFGSGTGFAIFGGSHVDDRWDLEMSFYSSKHDGEWRAVIDNVEYSWADKVEYTSLNFDAKYKFEIENEDLKPFVLIGFGFGTVIVKDGSSNGVNMADAKYFGMGLNVGVGLDYYVEPEISLGLAYIKRMTSYDEAEGISGTRGELSSDLNGDATALNVNLTYHILR